MQTTFGQMEADAPPGGFRVIYADPAWSYRDAGQSGSKTNSGAAVHYPTLTPEQIAGLNVSSIAADDSLCFMWITGPQMETGLEVLRSWGFDYVTTAFVWTKTGSTTTSQSRLREVLREAGMARQAIKGVVDKVVERLWPAFAIGQGSYTRANPEICILGRRGAGVKRVSAGVRSEVLEPPGRHSRKPDVVAERIVQLVGDVPRIELFAREARPGWWAWGNEVDSNLWHKPVRLHVPAPGEFCWQGQRRTILRVKRRRR